MKKFLGILAGIVILAIIILLLIGGLGLGAGSGGGGEGESEGVSERSSTTQEETASPKQEEDPAKELDVRDESGSNKDDSEEGTVIEVSVVKSEYFYENKSIELDALVDIITSVDGKLVVEVTDDNASLRAYNKLIDALEDHGVTYVEESV